MTINALANSLAATQLTPTSRYDTTSQLSSSAAVQADSPLVSSLGSDMKQLESLLGTNPDKFKEVTSTIAQKLEDAAKTAAANGDTQQAAALNDMAAKFKTASETGTMPHLHHGHGGPPPPKMDDSDSTSTSSSTSSTDTLATDLAKLLEKYTQNPATDPMSTLSGIMSSVFGTVTAA